MQFCFLGATIKMFSVSNLVFRQRGNFFIGLSRLIARFQSIVMVHRKPRSGSSLANLFQISKNMSAGLVSEPRSMPVLAAANDIGPSGRDKNTRSVARQMNEFLASGGMK